MQRHPAEIAARWLQQADRNVADAQDLLDRRRFHLACFLSQQSAEMALKAALVWYRGDYPRVHLIRTLIEELKGSEGALDDSLATSARTLDKFYTTTRYPDVLDYALPADAFSEGEAREALGVAANLSTFVHGKLDPLIS